MSSTHDPKRRNLVLGSLAAGCLLSLRVTAAAEQAPRTNEKPGATEGGKVSKPKANYQDKPKGNLKCANCGNFIPADTCKVVAGTVSPNGWCILYAPKAA